MLHPHNKNGNTFLIHFPRFLSEEKAWLMTVKLQMKQFPFAIRFRQKLLAGLAKPPFYSPTQAREIRRTESFSIGTITVMFLNRGGRWIYRTAPAHQHTGSWLLSILCDGASSIWHTLKPLSFHSRIDLAKRKNIKGNAGASIFNA